MNALISFRLPAFVVTVCLLAGCSPIGPQEIKYGSENCHSCKMTIVDNRFAAEIVNKKRKAYKFDDVHCLSGFLKEGNIQKEDIHDIYLNDYSNPGTHISTASAYFISTASLRSPMGGNIAAFKTEEEQQIHLSIPEARSITWQEILDDKK